MISEGKNLQEPNWQNLPPFQGNMVCDDVNKIAKDVDAWLETLGYTREGSYYRAGENTEKTVALFSHGGSSSAVLAHLLNLPFPYLIRIYRVDFTSITSLWFPDTPGQLVMPVLELVNDNAHIRELKAEQFFGN